MCMKEFFSELRTDMVAKHNNWFYHRKVKISLENCTTVPVCSKDLWYILAALTSRK